MNATLQLIVRCLLVISLAMLPLSSTLAYYQPQSEGPCPEMMTTQHKHNQDNVAVTSVKNCCDNIMANCDCTGATSCHSISTQHIVVAILTTSSVVAVNLNSQSTVTMPDHYHGYISSPDIQPPIV